MSQQTHYDPLKTISGSCLCGLVKFEISLPCVGMNNCHCSRCRKSSGAAFGTFLHTTTDLFMWVKGEAEIVNFIPNKGDPRPFCKECGSRVPVVNSIKKHVIIPAGLLDQAPDLVPSVNLYVGSKASWYSVNDNLPSFDENAPDEFWGTYFAVFQEKLSKMKVTSQ
jgi:hypothetical protein